MWRAVSLKVPVWQNVTHPLAYIEGTAIYTEAGVDPYSGWSCSYHGSHGSSCGTLEMGSNFGAPCGTEYAD